MPNFNGDVVFVDGSGQVRSQSGDLTLRADTTNTRDVIVGSGRSLRPDRDVAIDLGRPDLRWHNLETGRIVAHSGTLANGELVFNEFGFDFLSTTVNLDSSNLNLGNGSVLTIDGTSDFLSNGLAVLGGTVRVETNPEPNLDNTWRFGAHNLRFKEIFANSGIFNYLSPSISGTFLTIAGGDVLPENDAERALGSLGKRWARVHAASGIFNAIGAPTSGTFIESAASIVPNITNRYALGTSTKRWANLFAASGTFTTLSSDFVLTSVLTASTALIDDLSLRTSLTFPDTAGGGFTINQQDSLLWDAQGFDTDIINLTDWDWGGANLSTIGTTSTDFLNVAFDADINGMLETANTRPQTDRLYAIGTSALRYSRMHAASGVFNALSPATSGTFINVVGSLVPERDAIYSLGTSSLRWANIFAVSGTFSSRPTVNGSGVLLQGEAPANAAIALDITPAHGTDFVLIHGLGTVDWTWSMWRTDVTPIKAIIPKDIRPSGVNAVQIEIDSAISGRLVLTAAGASGVATGAVGMFQTTIDFGSTPIQENSFLVTNAFVTPSSILMAQVAYDTTSSKDLDEMEMDGLDLKLGQVNFGGFTIYARGLDGPVHGEFKINYSLANI